MSVERGVIGKADRNGWDHLVGRRSTPAPKEESKEFGDTDTQSRFSALRGFEILTCNETQSNDCEDPDQGFKSVATKAAAFKAGVPRPLAPQLNFQSFEVDDTNATHVQLRVISNQCTGTPGYQGEQDADPANMTDCDDSENSTQDGIVRAAELEVFSR